MPVTPQKPQPPSGVVFTNNQRQLNPQQINNIVAAAQADQVATQLAQQNAVTQRARATVKSMRR